MFQNDTTNPTERGGGSDGIRDFASQTPPARPPLRFTVEEMGSGVRCTVLNDGPLGRLNGAVRYDVYWAEDVDTSTAAGKAAGFARAVCLAPSIPATNIDHTQSSAMYQDPKYGSGYFYCCGVDAGGRRSAPTDPAQVTTGPVDTTIPNDVRHLAISESGKVANDTVFSELSVTCEPPENVTNFGGVQLYLEDYLAIGDVQQGYFHRWLHEGGINFSVLYPIARRRSSVAVTVTYASGTVTAAGGLLAVAKVGEQFELQGRRHDITSVTDTSIGLAISWLGTTQSTSDYAIIGKPTIYAVSVSPGGIRRGDIENAPSVDVLMDGELSPPNAPANIYLSNAGVAKRIEWDQVASETISKYSVYRSEGSVADTGMDLVPPSPSAGTILLDSVPQNKNLPTGSSYGRLQYNDTKFTPYEMETNAVFTWYVTTTNVRGDESAAEHDSGYCRAAYPNEIDPTLPSMADPKNYIYNAMLYGLNGVLVGAGDTFQDMHTGSDGSNLPGRPYQAASLQADGTGRFRGYTRLEGNDGGTGASGSLEFFNSDEILFEAPGVGNGWFVYGEVGAWNHGTEAFRKIEKGALYVLSCYLYHGGVTPDGTFYIFVQQMEDGVTNGNALLRSRDSSGVLTTDDVPFTLDASQITATETRFWATFQMDPDIANTKQIHYNFAWQGGTVGEIHLKKIALQKGEYPAPYTPDMGDTTVSVPDAASPTPGIGDQARERVGDVFVIRDQMP
jgi:hypothetical protein